MYATEGKLLLSLNVTDRILVIEATTPFDEKFAEEYQRQLMPLRKALEDKAWASMAVVSGQTLLLAPEVRQFLVAAISQARSMGLHATCLVLPAFATEGEISYWHELYNETGLMHRIFHNEDEAYFWLTMELAKN